MSAELIAIENWLYVTLSSDAALNAAAPGGVHADLLREQGRPGTVPPVYVVFSLSSEGEVEAGLCGDAAGIAPEYAVRAIAPVRKLALLETAAARIHALLKDASAALTALTGDSAAGQVFTHRVAPYRVNTVDAGREFYELGGIYRVDFRRTL